MKKLFGKLLVCISVIITIWFALSYIEIVCKNINPNPTYSEHNILFNICEWANKYHDIND